MVDATGAFSGFSVKDQAAAREFYENKLGIKVEDQGMGLELHLPGGTVVFVYEKEDHQPASFTVLNLVVSDIDKAVEQLAEAGIEMKHYDNLGAPQDEKGVLRGLAADQGPDIAWFTDPSDNVFSVLQDK